MFDAGGPGTQWIKRIRRVLDMVDTPSTYGSPGQGLIVASGGRKLEWLTLSTVYYALGCLILYSGSSATAYDADDTGLTSALAAASSGDTIWIPPATFTGNYTIPAGVYLVGENMADVVFSGKLTLSDGARLENLSIVRTANDSSMVICVQIVGDYEVHLTHVLMDATQSGAGVGVGLHSFGNRAQIYLHDCRFDNVDQDIVL